MSTHAWVHIDCVGLPFWKSIACVHVFLCTIMPGTWRRHNHAAEEEHERSLQICRTVQPCDGHVGGAAVGALGYGPCHHVC